MRTRTSICAALVLFALVAVPAAPAVAAKPAPLRPPGPRTLVVEWRRDVWQDPELRAMDEAGANAATIVTGLQRGGRQRWSPDGTRVGGYQKQWGSAPRPWDRALMSARADGSDERVVLAATDLDRFNVAAGHKSALAPPFVGTPFDGAAWSPLGGAMVFSGTVRSEGATTSPDDDRWRRRLYTVSTTGQLAQVTAGDGDFDHLDPHWSGTLNRIVFVRSPLSSAGVTGQQELWVVNPDGSGLQLLTDFSAGRPSSGHGAYLAGPVWSPDGSRIAVVGNLDAHNTPSAGDLWLLDVAVGLDGVVTVTTQALLRGDPNAGERSPAWAPDGSRIARIRVTKANDRQNRYQLVLGAVTSTLDSVIADTTKQSMVYVDWRSAPPS